MSRGGYHGGSTVIGRGSSWFSYRKPKKKRKGNARLALAKTSKGTPVRLNVEDEAAAEARRAEELGMLNPDGSRLLKKEHPRAKPKKQKHARSKKGGGKRPE